MEKTIPMHGPSIVKGLLQCVEHEAGVSGSGDAPANDAANIGTVPIDVEVGGQALPALSR
jgi:hypothetical protein